MALVIVFAVGVVLGWCARWREVEQLKSVAIDAVARDRAATDRLVQAWRDGYTVPDTPVPFEPEPDLPKELQEVLAGYPDPQAAARVEAAMRRKLNAGRTVDAILMDAEVGQL